MRYYLTFVKRIKDNTEARECFGMEDLISAKATAHLRMGNAMNDINCAYAFAVVLNKLGQVLYSDSFERPTEVTEEIAES